MKRTIEQLRLHNLRQLVLKSSATEVSKRLGYQQPTYISQMVGPKANRPLTEKNARKYEKTLGLKDKWFDQDHEQPAPPNESVALVTEVIRLVGTVLQSEKMPVDPIKFAEIVALSYEDSTRSGELREAHVRRLVSLLK